MASPRLDLVHLAIRSGVLGHVQWKPSAHALVCADSRLHGLRIEPAHIRAMLRQFVLDGNSLDVRQETRTEYLGENPDDCFWYRAVIPVEGLPQGLFIELKLIDDDEQEPWVEIVSAHEQVS